MKKYLLILFLLLALSPASAAPKTSILLETEQIPSYEYKHSFGIKMKFKHFSVKTVGYLKNKHGKRSRTGFKIGTEIPIN